MNKLIYAKSTETFYINNFNRDGRIKRLECIVPRLDQASKPRKQVRHYSSKVTRYFDVSLIEKAVA
jgi:hypothetical protein